MDTARDRRRSECAPTVDTTTPKKFFKKGKKKLSLIVTPKKCSGTWKAEGDFHFATGETVKTPISQKCKK